MKVLVSGPIDDQNSGEGWELLRNRVIELHSGKHGPFDLLILVPSLKMTTTSKPDHIHFPIQIATDTGVFGEHLTVEVVISASRPAPTSPVAPVDVLVTDILPENSGVPSIIKSSENTAEWALTTAPRYHFSGGSNVYFQRAPYRNEKGRPPTRLIALGTVGGKEKWIHALNITQEVSLAEPAGTTENPYIRTASRQQQASQRDTKSAVSQVGRQQFFFAAGDVTASSNKRMRGSGGATRKAHVPRVPPRLDCWFCLASPTCEQHLIASIGEEAYVALPKGGVRKEHVLVVPISHESSFAQFLNTDEALSEVAALQTQVESAFAKGGFAVLYTDRSLTFGKAPQQHGYLECLPVPVDKIETLENIFHEEAKARGITFESVGKGSGSSNRDNLEIVKSLKEYLFVQLPGGKAFVHYAQKASTENDRLRSALLQFGRAVACKVLDCPERTNWKSCVASKSQETSWTKSLAELMPEAPSSQE